MSIITPNLNTNVKREHVLYLVVHLPLEHGTELVVCHKRFSVQRLKYYHVFTLKEIRKTKEE
jgi:hypothetical protein